MNIILFMVSMALILSSIFVFAYYWAASRGQFDDMETPALRVLKDDFVSLKNIERNHHEK